MVFVVLSSYVWRVSGRDIRKLHERSEARDVRRDLALDIISRGHGERADGIS